jgi:hypothetical protein
MTRSAQLQIHCSICHKLVNLENTKTDDRGKAVHEECYVLREALKNATQPSTRNAPVSRQGNQPSAQVVKR